MTSGQGSRSTSRWIPKPGSTGLRYGAAVAIVAVATAFRALLGAAGDFERGDVPFISYFPAVLLAAWYGGLGPGAVALALSTGAAALWFVRPGTVETPIAVATFLFSSACILAIAEAFHRARRRAARSDSLLRLAQEAAGIGSFELAPDAQSVSPELCHLVGLDAAAAERPAALRERIHPDDRAVFDRTLAEALAGFAALEAEVRLLDPERWIALRGRSLAEAGKGPPVVAGIAFDVSLRKRAERERERLLAAERAAREAAEAGARARDTFLATMSHELRTPLSPILAWGSMLADGTLDEGAAAPGGRDDPALRARPGAARRGPPRRVADRRREAPHRRPPGRRSRP